MEDTLTLDQYYDYWNLLGMTMDEVNALLATDRTFTTEEEF